MDIISDIWKASIVGADDGQRKGEMMSLILKGIDLPRCSNEDCIVVIRKDKAEVRQTGFKERTVEAIQIPKDHGRLIDADKLRRGFSRTESGYCGYWEFCDKPEDVQFLIDDKPAILESEENNEPNTERD